MTAEPAVQGFPEWSRACQERIEELLRRLLPAADIAPQRLHAAMR